MISETLSKRLTHRYVGTCRDMDRWEPVGTMVELQSSSVPPIDTEEASEGPMTTKLIAVDSDRPKEEVEQALRDRFNRHGCSHSYDCCGCPSHRVAGLKEVSGKLYEVEIKTTFNY
jgi:hypothetical protein